MASITTSICNSFKSELMQASHNFNGSVTPTGNTTSASASVTSVSSMSGVVVGMAISGTGIPASTTVANITSATALTLSANATATGTGVTLTITGDPFYIALIGSSYTGTYDANITNYGTGSGSPSTSNVGTDEVSGTGYTAGGVALSNSTPTYTTGNPGTAYTTPGANPSWTSATFSTVGALIYNKSTRNGYSAGRSVSVHSFSGTQSVSSGTLTVVMPTNSSTQALIRLS